jgi:hypothetical protein
MNDIRIFTKHIDKMAADAVDIGQQIQSPSITVSGLTQQKKRADKLVDELYSFDGRFREIIDRKRTIRTLNREEETALEEFSKKRSKIMTDLKTEIKNIERHPLIKKPAKPNTPLPTEVARMPDSVADSSSKDNAVVKASSPKNKTVKKPRSTSPKNTTRSKPAKSSSTTDGEKKEKKPRASAKKETKADSEEEKQAKLLEKEQEKEREKQAKLLAKEREKQEKLLVKAFEKEREKQEKLLEKEREKQEKLLAKSVAKTGEATKKRSVKTTAKVGEPKMENTSMYNFKNAHDLRAAVKHFSEFRNAAIQKYGPMQNWNTENVVDMSDLFSDFEFTFDNKTDVISGWNVSKATDFSNMFSGCAELNQDLSKWVIQTGANTEDMFDGATQMLANRKKLPKNIK